MTFTIHPEIKMRFIHINILMIFIIYRIIIIHPIFGILSNKTVQKKQTLKQLDVLNYRWKTKEDNEWKWCDKSQSEQLEAKYISNPKYVESTFQRITRFEGKVIKLVPKKKTGFVDANYLQKHSNTGIPFYFNAIRQYDSHKTKLTRNSRLQYSVQLFQKPRHGFRAIDIAIIDDTKIHTVPDADPSSSDNDDKCDDEDSFNNFQSLQLMDDSTRARTDDEFRDMFAYRELENCIKKCLQCEDEQPNFDAQQTSDLFKDNWEKVVELFDLHAGEDLDQFHAIHGNAWHPDLIRAIRDLDRLRAIHGHPRHRAIRTYGWENQSAIQQYGIIPLIQKCDTIVQTQSRMGKATTFSFAALLRVNLKELQCQVLVVTSTRKLAHQIHKEMKSLEACLKVTTHVCVGGTAVHDDVQQLVNGVQIVVGTPGRVCDMISRGVLRLKAVKLFVLDEADEMLYSRVMREQIYDCFQYLPSEVRVALFSATIPNEILQLTERFMRNPLRILVKKEELTLDGIKQYYLEVEKEHYKL
eukprot:102758_1